MSRQSLSLFVHLRRGRSPELGQPLDSISVRLIFGSSCGRARQRWLRIKIANSPSSPSRARARLRRRRRAVAHLKALKSLLLAANRDELASTRSFRASPSARPCLPMGRAASRRLRRERGPIWPMLRPSSAKCATKRPSRRRRRRRRAEVSRWTPAERKWPCLFGLL